MLGNGLPDRRPWQLGIVAAERRHRKRDSGPRAPESDDDRQAEQGECDRRRHTFPTARTAFAPSFSAIPNPATMASMATSVASREQLHDAVAERLRHADQRYTTGRRALIDLLAEAARPSTIPELLDGRPTLAQSSVYRNLAVLEGAEVVHRVHGTDEYARYELAEDLTDHHHHHLICATCGTVTDFTVASARERPLEQAMARVASDTGFRPEHHRLDLVGVCSTCR